MIEALSRSNDLDVLIHLLSDMTAVHQAATPPDDPLRGARARAIEQRRALLTQEGGTLGVVEVGARLRLTRAGVDARRKTGKLLAIDEGSRTIAYPAWQFTEGGVLPGFEEVLAAFPIEDAMMKVSFFLSEDPDLGGRPLDVLKAGRLDEVRDAAARFGRLGDER